MNSLRTQLVALTSVGVVSLILVLLMVEGFSARIDRKLATTLESKDLTADILPPPLYLLELRLVASEVVEGSRTVAQGRAERDRLLKEYEARWQHWQREPLEGMDAALLTSQDIAARTMVQRVDALLEAGPEARPEALKGVQAAYADHRAAVDRSVQAATGLSARLLEQSTALSATAQRVEFGFALLMVGVQVTLGTWVLRRVMRSTGGEPAEVARVAHAVAAGDLTVSVPVRDGDSHSVMAAMRGMSQQLQEVVGRIRHASESISTGAQQIAGGNLDLSQRTEEQASNLQQTASAMEQFSGTVRHTADAAREATQLAEGASGVASRGASAMQGVVSTMQDITASSKKIAEITSVIDGIAFQTNILALNAAVEAARAGEQGRGFAVVAGEVRSLASRSAAAAKEINSLIAASVDKVQQGARQVQDAGATMDEIVGKVQQVTNLIGEIGSATQEQTAGIGMVSGAISELDGVTQQNAALVEESAAAAASLSKQAEALVDSLRAFRV